MDYPCLEATDTPEEFAAYFRLRPRAGEVMGHIGARYNGAGYACCLKGLPGGVEHGGPALGARHRETDVGPSPILEGELPALRDEGVI